MSDLDTRIWGWLPARATRARVTTAVVIAANLDVPVGEVTAALARLAATGHVIRDTQLGSRDGWHRGIPLERAHRGADAVDMTAPSLPDPVVQRRLLVAAWTRAGDTLPTIAARLGVSAGTVSADRRATGTSLPKHPGMTDQQIRMAGLLLADGCSYAETARTVGVTPHALRRRFPGCGWTKSEAARYGRALSRIERSFGAAVYSRAVS